MHMTQQLLFIIMSDEKERDGWADNLCARIARIVCVLI
jgi:hypothetical protein